MISYDASKGWWYHTMASSLIKLNVRQIDHTAWDTVVLLIAKLYRVLALHASSLNNTIVFQIF